MCRCGAWFAAWSDLAGKFTFADYIQMCRQVDQNPVKKIDAGQAGRYGSPFPVDIRTLAGNVRVVADEGKRTRIEWSAISFELRIAVFPEADVVCRVRHAEGKVT